MSNSAFTPTFAQNLQDASATQKGLVNTTTQTFAGKKTFDGGAAIKGDTSGNAIASGYVGEVIETQSSFSKSSPSDNTFYPDGTTSPTSITLVVPTAGRWLVTGQVLSHLLVSANNEANQTVGFTFRLSDGTTNKDSSAIIQFISATSGSWAQGQSVTGLVDFGAVDQTGTKTYSFSMKINRTAGGTTYTTLAAGRVILRAVRIA